MRILPIAFLLGGCAAATEPPVPPADPAAQCDIAPLQPMIGKTASAELATEAMRLSKARLMRWKIPGGVMTMDYRVDRLNIALDAQNIVTGFDCG